MIQCNQVKETTDSIEYT